MIVKKNPLFTYMYILDIDDESKIFEDTLLE